MSRVIRRKLTKGSPAPFKGRFKGTPQFKSSEDHPEGSSGKGPIPTQRRRPKLFT